MSDVDCPHCHATFKTLDVRIIAPGPDGTFVAMKHTKDCVDNPPEWLPRDEEPTT